MKYGMNLAWQLQLSEGKFIIDTAQLSAKCILFSVQTDDQHTKVNSLAAEDHLFKKNH